MEGSTLLFSSVLVHPCVHSLCRLKEICEGLYGAVDDGECVFDGVAQPVIETDVQIYL